MIIGTDPLQDILAKVDALEEAGDEEAALTLLVQEEAAHGGESHYWARRGYLLHKLERWSEAVSAYDRAIAGWPTAASTLFMRARAKEKLGRRADAVVDYLAASGAAPEKPDALLAVADLCLLDGAQKKARLFLDRAKELPMSEGDRAVADRIEKKLVETSQGNATTKE